MNLIAGFVLLLATVLQTAVGSAFVGLSQSLRTAVVAKVPEQTKIAYASHKYEPQAIKKDTVPSYAASAESALIYDLESGRVIYEKNSNQALPMASLTKLMTAFTLLQNHELDEVVTIPDKLPPLGPVDQKIGVTAGEKFYFRDLLQALLIYSANDVANALAVYDAGSAEKFVAKMNDNAKQWGLEKSRFTNPNGLDEFGNQASAKDLLTLSTILLQNENFRKVVNTEKATITSLGGKPYALTTTNKDLSLPSVYGIKTGFTEKAGQCLILLGRNKDGKEIITVVLNSPDRFVESKAMVDYTFTNYIWK